MGILESVKEPLADLVAQRSLSVVLGAAFVAFVALSIVLNVLSQALFKNPNEPPVVFHWLPIIGSTITYGIDPYKFFFECRAKVGILPRKNPEKGARLICA
jgi:sterol 14-demethylase